MARTPLRAASTAQKIAPAITNRSPAPRNGGMLSTITLIAR